MDGISLSSRKNDQNFSKQSNPFSRGRPTYSTRPKPQLRKQRFGEWSEDCEQSRGFFSPPFLWNRITLSVYTHAHTHSHTHTSLSLPRLSPSPSPDVDLYSCLPVSGHLSRWFESLQTRHCSDARHGGCAHVRAYMSAPSKSRCPSTYSHLVWTYMFWCVFPNCLHRHL